MKKIINKIDDLIWRANKVNNRDIHDLALEIKSDLEELDKITITWCKEEFEVKASENEGWYQRDNIYDRSKFDEALKLMISEHDAAIGISWDTITQYLNNYCKQ